VPQRQSDSPTFTALHQQDKLLPRPASRQGSYRGSVRSVSSIGPDLDTRYYGSGHLIHNDSEGNVNEPFLVDDGADDGHDKSEANAASTSDSLFSKTPCIHTRDVSSTSEVDSYEHVPAHWPSEPRKLEGHTFLSVLILVWDILLSLTPILFITLAGVSLYLHNRPIGTSRLETTTQHAIQLGPTIFPILFAALAGRTLKTIARFSAERGARLGSLELLIASRSVIGAVESQFLLRELSVVGAHILLLWAMSPLGGQASLRLLGKGQEELYSNATIKYLGTGPYDVLVSTLFSDNSGYFLQITNAIYGSALTASDRALVAPRDGYGNVRIPRLEGINTNGRH